MKVRHPLEYQVNKANTERYKCSSIPYMQRLLNDDNRKRKREMDDLNVELSKPKKKRFNNHSLNMQVNYVSTLDYHCRK